MESIFTNLEASLASTLQHRPPKAMEWFAFVLHLIECTRTRLRLAVIQSVTYLGVFDSNLVQILIFSVHTIAVPGVVLELHIGIVELSVAQPLTIAAPPECIVHGQYFLFINPVGNAVVNVLVLVVGYANGLAQVGRHVVKVVRIDKGQRRIVGCPFGCLQLDVFLGLLRFYGYECVTVPMMVFGSISDLVHSPTYGLDGSNTL